MIKGLIIFYFSGTGNSKKIADWFAECAMQTDIPCQIVDISKTDVHALPEIEKDILILFVSPTHGFNYPQIMLDFIRRFPKGLNPVVLTNTRAGFKLGKTVIPGLTGIALMLSSFFLNRKGYKIVGQIPFDMPSNWISIHPALRDKSIDFLYTKNRERVKRHFTILNTKGKDFAAYKNIVQDILISPVALAYYFVGRYFLSKSYYASHQCTNCNTCIKQCPVNAITVKNQRPYWTFKCESCMKCMNNCPHHAIETTHGLWLFVIYISSIITTYLMTKTLLSDNQHWLIQFLLFNCILIIFTGIFYRMQQWLLKNNFLANIIAKTSLTHYRFWGRYKSR